MAGEKTRKIPTEDALFGKTVVQQGLLSLDQVNEAIRSQIEHKRNGETVRLGEILVRRGMLTPEKVTFLGAAPLGSRNDAEQPVALPSPENVVTLPMVVCGELVGCIGLLLWSTASMNKERATILQVIAYHLGTAIRNAQIVEKASELGLGAGGDPQQPRRSRPC